MAIIIGTFQADNGILNPQLEGTASADFIAAFDGDDLLLGLAGADTLDGGLGADTMIGGFGNDFYLVDDEGDRIVEDAAAGNDTIRSTVDFALWRYGQNVEHLVLLGAVGLVGVGNALDNSITGTAGDDWLNGGAGDDLLIGGGGADVFADSAGADTMRGGWGSDTYYIDDVGDVIEEAYGQGHDVVIASVSYEMRRDGQHVEDLILVGRDDLTATGNGKGNLISGNAGNNLLDGAWGDDTLIGGKGNDTYIGGRGDDLFVIQQVGDRVVEADGEGVDTIETRVSYAMRRDSDFTENLVLKGRDDIDGTGNRQDNLIIGNDGDNRLNGAWGNDTLIGGNGRDIFIDDAGSDSMVGGSGNDLFYVDDAADVVREEAGEGDDTVRASVDYTMWRDSQNTEHLVLTGDGDLTGIGNRSDNTLLGNAGNNRLDGMQGDDTLTGGMGTDTLLGGAGNDLLDGEMADFDGRQFISGGGAEGSFGIYNYSNIRMALYFVNFDGSLLLYGLLNPGAGGVQGTFSDHNWVLYDADRGTPVHYLGNSAFGGRFDFTGDADLFEGGWGDDTFLGGAGADTMIGGAGFDTVDYAAWTQAMTIRLDGDMSVGSAFPRQTLQGIEHVIAGSGNDSITGSAGGDLIEARNGDDRLMGTTGNDTLDGGNGTDTVVYDAPISEFRGTLLDPVGGARAISLEHRPPSGPGYGTDTLIGVEVGIFDGVTIRLDGTNNAPILGDDTITTDEDSFVAFLNLLDLNDLDPDSYLPVTGDMPLPTTTYDDTSSIGSVFVGNLLNPPGYDPSGQFEYLAEGETAIDTFTYTVNDGRGGVTTATVTVIIEGRNDLDTPVTDTIAAPVQRDDTLFWDEATGRFIQMRQQFRIDDFAVLVGANDLGDGGDENNMTFFESIGGTALPIGEGFGRTALGASFGMQNGDLVWTVDKDFGTARRSTALADDQVLYGYRGGDGLTAAARVDMDVDYRTKIVADPVAIPAIAGLRGGDGADGEPGGTTNSLLYNGADGADGTAAVARAIRNIDTNGSANDDIIFGVDNVTAGTGGRGGDGGDGAATVIVTPGGLGGTFGTGGVVLGGDGGDGGMGGKGESLRVRLFGNDGDDLIFGGLGGKGGVTGVAGTNGQDGADYDAAQQGGTGGSPGQGGSGGDALYLIDGGTGNDVIVAGKLQDYFGSGVSRYELRGGAGNDTIFMQTADFDGNRPNSRYLVYGDDGDDMIVAEVDAPAGFLFPGQQRTLMDNHRTIDGGAGWDTFVFCDDVASSLTNISNVEELVMSNGTFSGLTYQVTAAQLAAISGGNALRLSGETGLKVFQLEETTGWSRDNVVAGIGGEFYHQWRYAPTDFVLQVQIDLNDIDHYFRVSVGWNDFG
ncbi:Ig-like domain-containing protein [Thetidibacter halocola]|uniref:VCBS domain-containing protein n=1 Tax=Thetidibacter halocola TaxID=2827239 RepID=A0A8J7WFN5_9RHOB|nr:VCBS domain-containing protein [Thetidibacter halocola]MBS0126805.1 VCBS domain-containing protein [Thetidibacter halocola]